MLRFLFSIVRNVGALIYRFLLLWTSKPTRILEFKMFIPQAFEAIASSSGGVQTLIGNYFNQGVKNTKSESETPTYKLSRR